MRRIVELGFLTDSDLSIFVRLIRNRRCLPVYRGGFWGCYECPFQSEDLQIIAAHIMCIHRPAPPGSEDELCEDTARSDTGTSVSKEQFKRDAREDTETTTRSNSEF